MSSPGIKGPASIIIVIPGDWVFSHIQTSLITCLVQDHQDINFFIEILIAVPFVCPFPRRWQNLCGLMILIHYFYCAFLYIGMWILYARVVTEIASHHLPIPSPFIFCIGSSVDTDISSTRLDVSLKLCFLIVVQYITCSA